MKIKEWLQSLSFRTGVIVLMCCIPFYILSFAQMLLPISTTAKGVVWAVLFGLAKTCQYGGLTILGVEGYKRLRNKFRKQKKNTIWFTDLQKVWRILWNHQPVIFDSAKNEYRVVGEKVGTAWGSGKAIQEREVKWSILEQPSILPSVIDGSFCAVKIETMFKGV